MKSPKLTREQIEWRRHMFRAVKWAKSYMTDRTRAIYTSPENCTNGSRYWAQLAASYAFKAHPELREDEDDTR